MTDCFVSYEFKWLHVSIVLSFTRITYYTRVLYVSLWLHYSITIPLYA